MNALVEATHRRKRAFALAVQQDVNIESIWANSDGVSMHARVALRLAPADAREIVLVHGLVVSSLYMQPLMEQLAPYYRVYAPDLPGFGDTEEPDKTLDVPGLADSLRHWMDSLGLERPLILGNSFGSQIAVEFAKNHPSRTRGLVLVGPTVDPASRSIVTQAARWFRNAVTEPPSLGLTLLRDFAKAGLIRSSRTLLMYINDPIESKLEKVFVPVLVVRGALDPISPQRWANELVRRLPDASQATIPGATHTTNYSAPVEVSRITRLFDNRLHDNHTD